MPPIDPASLSLLVDADCCQARPLLLLHLSGRDPRVHLSWLSKSRGEMVQLRPVQVVQKEETVMLVPTHLHHQYEDQISR